uniref:DCD domain-containing protein n=1 Tax=Kalanchoe fedtschenkoi TaxID=63787 RepID=A0A7N0VK42_KALFE
MTKYQIKTLSHAPPLSPKSLFRFDALNLISRNFFNQLSHAFRLHYRMGSKKKNKQKKIQTPKETPEILWPSTFRITARNLSSRELAGVIFGCKHGTMQECFAKQLFGLPSSHFVYIRNIKPGLPLFLFNSPTRRHRARLC